jgi:hypothetical protein
MKSLNLNFKFWLLGVIAGVILVERWRRYGIRHAPVPADKPKASTSIAAGAKADAERAKRLLKQTPTTQPA